MRRLSGLQLEVLKLYKEMLRKTKKNKDLQNYIKTEFAKDAKIPKNSIQAIEWKLRNGRSKLEIISSENFNGLTFL